MPDKPSSMIIAQRIRNGIIAYLEIASSFEEQLDYQEKVPFVRVPDEIINEWEDLVNEHNRPIFREPVFSVDEQAAIKRYQEDWNLACQNTPDPLPELEELFTSDHWNLLQESAQAALAVFQQRGRFAEDQEAFPEAD